MPYGLTDDLETRYRRVDKTSRKGPLYTNHLVYINKPKKKTMNVSRTGLVLFTLVVVTVYHGQAVDTGKKLTQSKIFLSIKLHNFPQDAEDLFGYVVRPTFKVSHYLVYVYPEIVSPSSHVEF